MSSSPQYLSDKKLPALVYIEECYRDVATWQTFRVLTPPRKKNESLDRNKRKMFYIGESDNDDLSCRRTGRSPSNTVRKRHTKGLHEKKYFTDTFCPGKYSTRNCQLSPQYRTGKTLFHSPKPHKQIVTARILIENRELSDSYEHR